MYNILVCDDERDIVSALKIYLEAEGYKVFCAYNGNEAVKLCEIEDIHLVLLDIMMPVSDGLSALAEIRKRNNIPVILLTAKSEDCDIILGLNVGADDYVTKPFNPIEVIARVRSQLRRYMVLGSGTNRNGEITIGNICLNDESKTVCVDGDAVLLTPLEYDILKLLMKNAGKVYSPREIYKIVWGEDPVGMEGAVAVHIRHLREKLEIQPASPRYIKVVWGQGYKMEDK
ncbi:MAG: response regulator transcription factor [Clostridia bacterium]|nr:response regulator transcription factor [Clostridia bacterium]